MINTKNYEALFPGRVDTMWQQGCQIFLCTTYQNEINTPKWPQYIPNGQKIFQMAVK
jgi:hypothetical protein